VVRKKVLSMITDPKRIRRDDPGHPEECNVCQYYRTFSPAEHDAVAERCRTAAWGCTDCKARLADILIELLAEPRARREELEAHPERLRELLADGARRAQAVARETLDEVKALTGLGPLGVH
jgi:tryptophanyl-tRNA synthetase